MFSGAVKAGRRCIIPISGFYEWAMLPDGNQPFLISGRDAPILAVAGLHELRRSPEGEDRKEALRCTNEMLVPVGAGQRCFVFRAGATVALFVTIDQKAEAGGSTTDALEGTLTTIPVPPDGASTPARLPSLTMVSALVTDMLP